MSGVIGSDNVRAESDGAESGEVSDVDCSNSLTIRPLNNRPVSVERPAKAAKIVADVVREQFVAKQPGAVATEPSAKTHHNYSDRQKRRRNKQQKYFEEKETFEKLKSEAEAAKCIAAQLAAERDRAIREQAEISAANGERARRENIREAELLEQIRELESLQEAGKLQLAILESALHDYAVISDDLFEKVQEVEKLKSELAARGKSIESLTARNLELAVKVRSLHKPAASSSESSRVLGSQLTENNIRDWIQRPPSSKP